MDKLLMNAFAMLGLKEIPGSEHNDTIIHMAHELGHKWVNDDETPWCATFANWVIMTSGFKHSGKLSARSLLDIGLPVEDPFPGDVVVFYRGDKNGSHGHVGFFLGFNSDKTKIFTLGGNQGNAVSVATYPTDKLLGFRRIGKSSASLPNPILKKGDNGANVKALQEFLNLKGFNCGKPDGDFGSKTEIAIKSLQKKGGLTQDGVYGKSSFNYLTDLLGE